MCMLACKRVCVRVRSSGKESFVATSYAAQRVYFRAFSACLLCKNTVCILLPTLKQYSIRAPSLLSIPCTPLQ